MLLAIFSSADVNLEGRKREATLKLALDLYAGAGAEHALCYRCIKKSPIHTN